MERHTSQDHPKGVVSAVCADKLEGIEPTPTEAYCPLLPPNCTVVLEPNDYYVKQPDLISFGGTIDLVRLVLQELGVCKILRAHPHPNIATYYGCLASDGRVSGLCFQRYPETLMDKLNPDRLNKSAFILSEDRTVPRKMATRYLSGIEAGIRRLHTLGLVHNDLNPANVMITEDDTPVIVDFDSSSAPGTALNTTKRTHGWFDAGILVSRESNDLDALAELRVWLSGASPDEFRFKE